jgi:hypothetical protein
MPTKPGSSGLWLSHCGDHERVENLRRTAVIVCGNYDPGKAGSRELTGGQGRSGHRNSGSSSADKNSTARSTSRQRTLVRFRCPTIREGSFLSASEQKLQGHAPAAIDEAFQTYDLTEVVPVNGACFAIG